MQLFICAAKLKIKIVIKCLKIVKKGKEVLKQNTFPKFHKTWSTTNFCLFYFTFFVYTDTSLFKFSH